VTLNLDFKVTQNGVTIDAIDVLCAQLTRDLFAIAKFLYLRVIENIHETNIKVFV